MGEFDFYMEPGQQTAPEPCLSLKEMLTLVAESGIHDAFGKHLPPESFFSGWRIDHGIGGPWTAESPDSGARVEAKTLRGLVRKMARAWLKEIEQDD
jgi:hypothetical protein